MVLCVSSKAYLQPCTNKRRCVIHSLKKKGGGKDRETQFCVTKDDNHEYALIVTEDGAYVAFAFCCADKAECRRHAQYSYECASFAEQNLNSHDLKRLISANKPCIANVTFCF